MNREQHEATAAGRSAERAPPAASQPAAAPLQHQQQQQQRRLAPDSSGADCLSCRVTGTLVCGACSAYLLAVNYTRLSPPAGAHRLALLALSGGFASMAVVRALT